MRWPYVCRLLLVGVRLGPIVLVVQNSGQFPSRGPYGMAAVPTLGSTLHPRSCLIQPFLVAVLADRVKVVGRLPCWCGLVFKAGGPLVRCHGAHDDGQTRVALQHVTHGHPAQIRHTTANRRPPGSFTAVQAKGAYHTGMRRTLLIDRRNAMAMSQEDLARHCEVDPDPVGRWERGVTTPRRAERRRLARALSWSLAELDAALGGSSGEARKTRSSTDREDSRTRRRANGACRTRRRRVRGNVMAGILRRAASNRRSPA
jgi:ribosome-binding protein aMBF1 (putative translation factor)